MTGPWYSCPSPVVIDTAAQVQMVADLAAVLFLLFAALIAVVIGFWVSSMTD